jgi:hypothetical protein
VSTPAIVKAQVESALGGRFATYLTLRPKPDVDLFPTGVAEIDAVAGGVPRGAITEICGPASSGRTSLLVSLLAEATGREEACALVDSGDAFDPVSAAATGVDLDRLLWVRCGGHPDHALKAADMLVQGGGFGFVVIDFADVPPRITSRIPMASWFRFRRAIENTPTALVVLEREPTLKSCASLILEMRQSGIHWVGRLLRGMRIEAVPRKPASGQSAGFDLKAVG